MKIEKIDHVGILVKNVNEAVKFFADLFELRFVVLGEVKEMDVRSAIEPTGIEMFEPLLQDGVMARTLGKRGEGLSLLSLKVPNLNEAMAEMTSRGIRLIGQMQRGKMRAAIYHPKDTFGVMIELIQYETEHAATVKSMITAASR